MYCNPFQGMKDFISCFQAENLTQNHFPYVSRPSREIYRHQTTPEKFTAHFSLSWLGN